MTPSRTTRLAATPPRGRLRVLRSASLAIALVAGGAIPAAAVPLTASGSATVTTATTATTDTTDTDGTEDTVTITVDADAIAQLCDERLPELLTRAASLIARIEGDASTRGSAAWVQARADEAAADGRDDLARRLEFRADQRLGHVDELEAAIARLEEVDRDVCSQVAP